MRRASQDFRPFVLVLFAVRAGAFIGRTQELNDGDEPPRPAIADFHIGQADLVHCRQEHVARRRKGCHRGFSCLSFGLTGLRAQGSVNASQEAALIVGQLMDINVFIDLEKVVWADLRFQHLHDPIWKLFMKVVPGIFVFQIGVHSWKR